jgi:hypothetical protein
MQTVYILKDSYKNYKALIKLYNSADLSTNIIIVNKFYSKILLLDKRVKTFPFIINSLPTNIGLIPKFAKVLPLELFLQINTKKDNPIKKVKDRVITYNTHNTLHDRPQKKSRNLHIHPSVTPSILNKLPKKHIDSKQSSRSNNYYRKPLIKTVKESDGSVNIIMK